MQVRVSGRVGMAVIVWMRMVMAAVHPFMLVVFMIVHSVQPSLVVVYPGN